MYECTVQLGRPTYVGFHQYTLSQKSTSYTTAWWKALLASYLYIDKKEQEKSPVHFYSWRPQSTLANNYNSSFKRLVLATVAVKA